MDAWNEKVARCEEVDIDKRAEWMIANFPRSFSASEAVHVDVKEMISKDKFSIPAFDKLKSLLGLDVVPTTTDSVQPQETAPTTDSVQARETAPTTDTVQPQETAPTTDSVQPHETAPTADSVHPQVTDSVQPEVTAPTTDSVQPDVIAPMNSSEDSRVTHNVEPTREITLEGDLAEDTTSIEPLQNVVNAASRRQTRSQAQTQARTQSQTQDPTQTQTAANSSRRQTRTNTATTNSSREMNSSHEMKPTSKTVPRDAEDDEEEWVKPKPENEKIQLANNNRNSRKNSRQHAPLPDPF